MDQAKKFMLHDLDFSLQLKHKESWIYPPAWPSVVSSLIPRIIHYNPTPRWSLCFTTTHNRELMKHRNIQQKQGQETSQDKIHIF